MIHADALEIANDLLAKLRPYCIRAEIAGSLRRGKADVKDIEIVCKPVLTERWDLFGRPAGFWNSLDVVGLSDMGRIIKAGPRYKQIDLGPIVLDMFVVLPPAQWGVIFTIRTGPADFSHWCVTPRKAGGGLPSDCVVKDGQVWRGGQAIAMPEESDFLAFLGLGWIEPSDRAPAWSANFR